KNRHARGPPGPARAYGARGPRAGRPVRETAIPDSRTGAAAARASQPSAGPALFQGSGLGVLLQVRLRAQPVRPLYLLLRIHDTRTGPIRTRSAAGDAQHHRPRALESRAVPAPVYIRDRRTG